MAIQTRGRALGVHGRNLSSQKIVNLPPQKSRKGPSKLAKISKYLKPIKTDRRRPKRSNCH